MIQDIYPKKLYNEYRICAKRDDDLCLVFNNAGEILSHITSENIQFPTGKEIDGDMIYLFAVDSTRYFLKLSNEDIKINNYTYNSLNAIRDNAYNEKSFIAFSAYHLWKWYHDNKYCGRCATRLEHSDKERALVCPNCHNTIYPRINPAVIVGVTNGDKILITRYKNGYAHNALIAGFTEFGGTLKETVIREVKEEAGIHVTNIRYYKSQPWGIAQDILMGFFCDVDGDDTIQMDKNELKYAEWVKREDIQLQPDNLSLTNEMMLKFKSGDL